MNQRMIASFEDDGLLRTNRVIFGGLDRYAELPDDLVVATTEVGVLGASMPNKTVIDLAGLNTAQFAKQAFDPSALFATRRPDVIYMPHWHYVEMNEALKRDPTFRDRSKIQMSPIVVSRSHRVTRSLDPSRESRGA